MKRSERQKAGEYAAGWRAIGRRMYGRDDDGLPSYHAEEDDCVVAFGLSDRRAGHAAMVIRRVRLSDMPDHGDPPRGIEWLRQLERALTFELDRAVRRELGIAGEV